MKNVLIGIAAGIAIGYVLRKMEDDGKFKCIHDDMSELADRAKKKIKDVVDKGVNEAEYIGDRVEHITDKVKERGNKLIAIQRIIATICQQFCQT